MNSNRLSKILARSGIASRRACEQLIFEGKVRVNATVIKTPQTFVDPEKDKIFINNAPLIICDEKLYFVLNKPNGYICSNKMNERKKLVVDLFSHLNKRLFTVGRLDRDTTGLLLVTNDGYFAQDVIHPSKNLRKEYLVKTHQEITADHLKDLANGTLLEGKWTRPKHVVKVRKGTFKIVVTEGKKREVRLMVQNAGLSLVSLKRIRIGGLKLGDLEEGQFRPLSEKERHLIFT